MSKLNLNRSVVGSVNIEIPKSVELVFAFVVDRFFENYPRWAREVVEFKPINNNAMAEGALAKQIRYDQGHRVESTFEIQRIIPHEALVLMGLSDPFQHSFHFKRVASHRTLLTERFQLLEIELFMWPFEKLIRAAIEEGLQHSLQNIQTLLCDENYQ